MQRTLPPLRLFTPGPLNTSAAVRAAAAVDMGSRTAQAQALTARLLSRLEQVAALRRDVVVVPLQGSGTFALEAMLCSLVAEEDHVLVVENGVYSARMTEICRRQGLRHTVLAQSHERGFEVAQVRDVLAATPGITHIAAVHFETALGVINDITALSRVAADHGARLLVDAISTFGALPLDLEPAAVGGVALSSNKCLHGLPGIAFVIAASDALGRRRAPLTLSLDLAEQHRALKTTGQWRFTPPLQVMRALDLAIEEYMQAGGQPARLATYQARARRLLTGLEAAGYRAVIDAAHRAPLIFTFGTRNGERLHVASLDEHLAQRGLVIYPTKHSNPDTFRVGVIGEIADSDIDELVNVLADWRERALATDSPEVPESAGECPA